MLIIASKPNAGTAAQLDHMLRVAAALVPANAAAVAYADAVQASMTQLLLYYTRMLELLKKQGPEGVAAARDAVNIPAIMYEIKRITKG
jgi:hypothetical protein